MGEVLHQLNFRGAFRIQLNIYDVDFLRKQLTAKSHSLFLRKGSIVDIRVGSKFSEFFAKFQPTQAKPSRCCNFCQQEAFLCFVFFFFSTEHFEMILIIAIMRINDID